LRPEFWRFSHNKEKTMHLQIDRRPPPIEEVVRRMKARIDRDGIRIEQIPFPGVIPRDETRRQRSLRSCHLPAEPKPRLAQPRDTGAYVPEMAARIEDDRNLTDGARSCARKLAEYIYRKNRAARSGDITVTWLMRALGKSRRNICGSLNAKATSPLRSFTPAPGCAPDCSSNFWPRCCQAITGKNGRRS